MKIALIEAGLPEDSLAWQAWVAKDGRFAVPSVGLVSLASLVRDGDEVELIDEKVSGPVQSIKVDLVGISYKTMNAARAYELADNLRSGGSRVVLGGVHASLCPEEAAQHADIVVAGEGESVWPQLLDDVDQGTYKPVYHSPPSPMPIDTLPRQRIELIDHSRYLFHQLQSARGCSLDCEFCPTRAMFGAGFRLRDINQLMGEVRRLLEIDNKPILFVDGVFGAGEPRFIGQLTDRLKALPIQYAVICDLKMMTPLILKQLASGGCKMMTINITNLPTAEEIRMIREIQDAGIDVLGYIMFGFDSQKPDVFGRMVDFVRENDVRHVSLTLLSPYPGTAMGDRYEAEGRILSHDLSLYDQSHVVFKPAQMTVEELEKGFDFVLKEIGDLYNIERTIAEIFYKGGQL